MGFFTDAYDLFVIGIASTLITKDWNLSPGKLAVLNSTMLAAACLGALVFGCYADMVGRKRVYWLVAAIMIVGALGSALSGSFWMLIGFRFLLGLGVGGDYPVSAVMVSEYANRKDRGRLVGMVFGTQAIGLIVGPLIALALLGSGASNDVAWRILLALGAVPAAAVIYLRCRMPESPRYQVQVQGRSERAASCLLREHDLHPQILGLISQHASTMTKTTLQLAIFVVAAVPGYVLAIARIDRVGHRRLQLAGFAVMALCFATLSHSQPSMPPFRRVGKLAVHVLGSTVGLAGQKTFLDADPRKEAVDPESKQDRHHDVDPPHADHHFLRKILHLHLPHEQRLNTTLGAEDGDRA
jgi:MFS transporter, PHS family, inorganic phosphate transporter